MNAKSMQRAAFRIINRYIVVPAFKRGFGRFISNPVLGQIMVLKTTGRKTGKIRYTPVNYAVVDASICCYQGRHLKGAWYLNILANPQMEVILPSAHLAGYAVFVSDPQEAAHIIRQILKNAGLGGYVYGFNPSTVSEEELKKKTRGIPVIRIKAAPAGIPSVAVN